MINYILIIFKKYIFLDLPLKFDNFYFTLFQLLEITIKKQSKYLNKSIKINLLYYYCKINMKSPVREAF